MALSSRGRPRDGIGDKEVRRVFVLTLRGRPTGRFGDTEPALVTDVSLRGRPRPLTGDVFAALSSKEFFLGRPRPLVGDVCAGLSTEGSLRGRPRPRVGDVCTGFSNEGILRGRPRPRLGERITTGLESSCTMVGWGRALFLSGDAVVVENERASSLLNDVLARSGIVIDMLASKGCSAVLLAGDVANSRGRSVDIKVVVCGCKTESSLRRNIQSSPAGGSSTTAATGGACSTLSGEVRRVERASSRA